jgi:glycosyltransferase involved in cell wall biosynthesis
MRILLVMDPGIPVPPTLYGGHERLVYLFAGEYKKLGHEVTLLAGPQSYCSGKTVTFGTNDLGRSKNERFKETRFVWKYLRKNKNNFDLVHNFGRLAYLLPILNSTVKKIMTYGRPVAPNGIKIVTTLPNRNLVFTACSDSCVATGNVSGRWETVYNAIDFSQYELKESVKSDAPLMFLGRLDKIKGVHTAIRVAKATSSRLWIGGNIPDTSDNYAYYKSEIEPKIDNEQIIYLGALNDLQKNKYLGEARALLFPIEWDEPFGMVMIEAMACGTPVIAFNRGSVAEVVSKETGIIVDTADEMTDAINNLSYINRSQCRATAYARFNVDKIANDYLNL